MDRKQRNEIRKMIVQNLEDMDNQSISRKERQSVRTELVENLSKLDIGVASQAGISTPSFDQIKIGDVTESNIVQLLEKAYSELSEAGHGESEVVEMLKEPLIAAIQKIEASEMIQEALESFIDNKSDSDEEEDEEEDEGPGGHKPDGTGPHGRGEGPGKGKADGSGLKGDDEEEEENIEESLLPFMPRQNSLANKGVYILNQVIMDQSVAPVTEAIIKHNMDEKKLDHITLIVSSNGGDVEAAFGVIDVIKASRIPVHTVAMGKVKSAGLLIAMAGKKGHRSIMPNTAVLSHEFAVTKNGTRETETDLKAASVMYSALGNRIDQYYEEQTELSAEIIKKELRTGDRWLTAKQAIEYGLVDKIETGEFFTGSTIQESVEASSGA